MSATAHVSHRPRGLKYHYHPDPFPDFETGDTLEDDTRPPFRSRVEPSLPLGGAPLRSDAGRGERGKKGGSLKLFPVL